MTPKFQINTRVLQFPLTGMQRYVRELINRFGDEAVAASPQRVLSRSQANAWEQFVLPISVGKRVLFCPANTGPLIVSKQVLTIHDVAQLDRSGFAPELNDDIDSKAGAWYRFLTPRLVQRVAHVITISQFSKERLLTHTKLDEERVTVIPNGVDSRFAPQSEAQYSEKLSSLRLPCRYYVLCVGSLEPRKNLGRLLRAWSRIQSEVPDDVWLVLTGRKGSERIFADDARLSRLPPRIHLTGYVPDDALPALYAGALAFAFPSVYEGFGLPPLEAMASGVPVLTGNRASLPEVVGDAGLMVDPYDVEAIADGLRRLIEDGSLRSQLRTKGLEQARPFSWDRTAERTRAVLNMVAQG